MKVKLVLELEAEEAKNLLYLIQNTEHVVDSVSLVTGKVREEFSVETFAMVQSGILDNLSETTSDLKKFLGKD